MVQKDAGRIGGVLLAGLLLGSCFSQTSGPSVHVEDAREDGDRSSKADWMSGEVSGCVDDMDCDDHVDCTRNMCVQGRCVYTPDDSLCQGGETCNPAKGGCFKTRSCFRDEDCNEWILCAVSGCDQETHQCRTLYDDTRCPGKSLCVSFEWLSLVSPDLAAPGLDAPYAGCIATTRCQTDAECAAEHNPCVQGRCAGGICSFWFQPESSCDDGDLCTGPGTCHYPANVSSGNLQECYVKGTACLDPPWGWTDQWVCLRGETVSCEDHNECTEGQCHPDTGECQQLPLPDDTSCQKGLGGCEQGHCSCRFLACQGTCCGENGVCLQGGCCLPDCTGRECGTDGCDGECGTCPPHHECQSGSCVYVPYCGDGLCDPVETCDSCPEDCDACCGNGICQPTFGEHCGNCPGDCPCAGCGEACNNGNCEFIACEGRGCGPDGCGGSCGSCPEHHDCQDGSCVYVPWCGDGVCDAHEHCGTCPMDCPCLGCGESCVEGACQFSACHGKECGSDGCGGSCGSCLEHHVCLAEGLCYYHHTCGDSLCGPDENCSLCPEDCGPCCGNGVCEPGYGENCGNCPEDCVCTQCGHTCVDITCTFTACDGRECGPDGCGGSCGTCPEHHLCLEDGSCLCLPQCTGKQCGPDGCGGTCGSCGANAVCLDGQCVRLLWTDPSSGLTWQATPTGGKMPQSSAAVHCQALLMDGGGWRLPTITELRSLIRGCPATELGGSCNVQEGVCLSWGCRSACTPCSANDGPASGCYWPSEMYGSCASPHEDRYWSSSPIGDSEGNLWIVVFGSAGLPMGIHLQANVRCVR